MALFPKVSLYIFGFNWFSDLWTLREDTYKKSGLFSGRNTKVLPSLHQWLSGPCHIFLFFFSLIMAIDNFFFLFPLKKNTFYMCVFPKNASFFFDVLPKSTTFYMQRMCPSIFFKLLMRELNVGILGNCAFFAHIRTVWTEIHEQNISRRYQQMILIDLSWRLSEKRSLDSVC